jgi:hypothetical protein
MNEILRVVVIVVIAGGTISLGIWIEELAYWRKSR